LARTLVIVNTKFVARGIFDPLKYHWHSNGAVPAAVTEKAAAAPLRTNWFAGCATMAAGTGTKASPDKVDGKFAAMETWASAGLSR